MKSNSGIVINDDGTLNAKNLAVGDNASVNFNSESNQEKLIEKVNELLGVLENEKNSLSNFEVLKQASGTVQTEVNKDAPDKNVILTLLSLISSSVPAISGVIPVIKAIKELFNS